MKYIKTYEGLFDVFKSKEKLSDEKIVKDYINHYENILIDLNVNYDARLKCININELFIYDDSDNIINNGKELKCSESLRDKLYNMLSDIVSYNHYVVDTLARFLGLGTETRERLIEFDVIRNGDIDIISLESLIEYCKNGKQTPFQKRNGDFDIEIPNIINYINREIRQRFIMNTARNNMY